MSSDDEDDLYGENDPSNKCKFPKVNKITLNDLYNPHRVGACCTATSMIINGKLDIGYYHPSKLKIIIDSNQNITNS